MKPPYISTSMILLVFVGTFVVAILNGSTFWSVLACINAFSSGVMVASCIYARATQ